MKNGSIFVVALGILAFNQPLFAEEVTSAEAAVVTEAMAPIEEAAVVETAPATEAPVIIEENALDQENLEFVSGEVSAVDEAAQSVTVKLYGETEQDATDKTLTVKLDETTDITDGEKDRDAKSLTAGTEVDVEYDPKTSKATYIFVY